MDPLTIISALGLVGSLITGAAGAIPTKADLERKKRLKELTALEEADAFGLTEKQKQELRAIGMEPVQAAQREQRARAGEMVGLQEIGAGGTILRQEAEQEGIKEATRQLGQTVAQLDRERAAQQKQELEGLRARRDAQQEIQKQAAIASAEDIIVGSSQVAASAQQAKMTGLLQGNEKALRNAIAADLQSGNAYTMQNGKQVFNPLFRDQLRSMNFSDAQINLIEDMDQSQVLDFFSKQIFRMPGSTVGFGPERYGVLPGNINPYTGEVVSSIPGVR